MKNFIVAALVAIFISGSVAIINVDRAHAAMTVLAQVSLSNARVVSHVGSSYSVAFDIFDGGDAQTGIRYGVELVPVSGGKADYSNIADSFVAPDSISIASGQTKSLKVDYIAPSSLSGDFQLIAAASNESGLPLGTAHIIDMSLSASDAVSIDGSSCYLTASSDAANTHYSLTQGVDVASSESLVLHCKATSSFETPVTATPSIATALRSAFGDSVATPASGAAISFAAHESKNIAISIPKPSAPQAYTSSVSLRSASGIASNAVSVHWVLQGESATIQDVALDKSAYAVGDVAEVSFLWTGRADSFSGSRIGSSTPAIGDLVAHVTLCGQTVDKALSDIGGRQSVHVIIASDCFNPNVSVSLATPSSQLDSLTSSIKTYASSVPVAQQDPESALVVDPADAAPSASSSTPGSLAAYLIVALCVFALALIFGALRFLSANSKKARMIVFVAAATGAAAICTIGSASTASAYMNFYGRNRDSQTSDLPTNLPQHYIEFAGASSLTPVAPKYQVSNTYMPWYQQLISSAGRNGISELFNLFYWSDSDDSYVEAATAANARGSYTAPWSSGRGGNSAIDVRTFLATTTTFTGTVLNAAGKQVKVQYQCGITNFPTFAQQLKAFYKSGSPIPIDIAHKDGIGAQTCTHKTSATSTVTTQLSLADATVTIDLVTEKGTSTRAYSSSLGFAADSYTAPVDFTGSVVITLSYKLASSDGVVLGSYVETERASMIEWDVTLLQGGTVSWSNPISHNPESATLSINKTSFLPGETITFTATDPVTLACTNGAQNFPKIQVYVLPVNASSSAKTLVATYNSSVSNKPILNTPSAPLAPGDYYLLATYSDSFNYYHNYVYSFPIGTVRIPFTVVSSASAPSIDQAAPSCSAAGYPLVDLGWSYSGPAFGARIMRSSNGGSTYSTVDTVSSSTRTYTDYGDTVATRAPDPRHPGRTIATTTVVRLAPLSQYAYEIANLDVFGNASPSSPVSVTTPDCSATSTATTTIPQNPATTTPSTGTSTPTNPGTGPGPGNGGIGACPAILHATLCPGSDTSSVPPGSVNTVERSSADCQSTGSAPLMCEFYCNAPYSPQNNHCVVPDIREL